MTGPSLEFVALQNAVAGRYSLERELGRGGMGIVFLARDVALERRVAIKLLPPHLATDATLHARFLREARTAAQLMHPNIVPIHAVEETASLLYFVMAFVDGETLTQRVKRRGPLAPDDAARLTQELSWALSYAHAQGVVHRDIKPDNILIERATGRALVADFGIARVTTRDTVGESGALVGTLEYMSPEQASGDTVDGRSDIYSLGGTVYFALTGASPIEPGSLMVMMGQLMNASPPSLADRRTDLPPALTDAVARCLQKAPGDRFESAEQLAAAAGIARSNAPTIPVEVRLLLKDVGPFGFVGGLGLSLTACGGILATAPALRGVGGGLAFAGVMTATVALLFTLAYLPMIGRTGTSLRELDEAITSELVSMKKERRALLQRFTRQQLDRSRRAFGRWALGLLGGSAVLFAAWAQFPRGARPGWLMTLSAVSLVLSSWSGIFYTTLKLETPPAAWGLSLRLFRRLAGSPLGRRLLEGSGTRKSELAPAAAATATLLVRRVQELFGSLGPGLRERLSGIVPAAEELERFASICCGCIPVC